MVIIRRAGRAFGMQGPFVWTINPGILPFLHKLLFKLSSEMLTHVVAPLFPRAKEIPTEAASLLEFRIVHLMDERLFNVRVCIFNVLFPLVLPMVYPWFSRRTQQANEKALRLINFFMPFPIPTFLESMSASGST